MRPSNDGKMNFEYVRNTTCNIFTFIESFGRKHYASVHVERTAVDWSLGIRYLSDEMHSNAEKSNW